ncbi:MAG TPA: acylglycerol kinase family protein, partial [Candidatus Dormibacteraeota bacterium]
MSKTVPGRSTKTTARSAGKAGSKRATSLLILSSKAGSMTPAIEAKLRKSFPNSLVVEFDPKLDIDSMISPKATVIVAGGDGTIGWVVRRLADTRHPVGILSMGTFNNFAKSLGLPTNVTSAIRVVQTGRPRPITLGRVNG